MDLFMTGARSMVLPARWVALLVVVFVFSTPASAVDWHYTVRPGDTLWSIAKKYLDGERYASRLQQYNGIKNPRSISPGTRLRLPIRWLRFQPAPARVAAVSGTVELLRPGVASTQPVDSSTKILAGDSVRTLSGSSVTVEFADGSRLLVQQDSEAVFNTLNAYGDTGMVDTGVRLQRGRVENRVRPRSGPASRYRIETPAAVAATRGTRFRVGVDDSGELMRGEVLESAIDITGSGVTRELPEDFGLVARAGEPPSAPKQLLPAPDLSQTGTGFKQLEFDLEWPALAGADAYRAQLFDAGERLFFDQLLKQPQIVARVDADGQYRLRVRAIDDLGLEGRNAEHMFQVEVPDEPLLAAPAVPLVYARGQQLQFVWQSAPGAERYEFELARGTDFTDTVERLEVGQTVLSVSKPAPGVYAWRVRGISATGLAGTYSERRIELTTDALRLVVP